MAKPKSTTMELVLPLVVFLGLASATAATVWYATSTIAAANPDVTIPFPMSLEGVQEFERAIKQLSGSKTEIIIAFCALYTFLQAFSIPGSFVMNLAGGVLLGSAVGVPLIALLTTFGSLACYLMSWTFGGPLLRRFGMIEKLEKFARRIKRAEREGTLFFYMMTVRAFPMSPHWFLNLASPWVGISPIVFAPTILIGKMPYVWAIVTAGELVSSLTPGQAIIGWQDQLKLAGLALLLGAPALLMRLCGRKVASPMELLFGDEEEAGAEGKTEAGKRD